MHNLVRAKFSLVLLSVAEIFSNKFLKYSKVCGRGTLENRKHTNHLVIETQAVVLTQMFVVHK